jgi:16S rRNA (guanine1207-N2)-methyltransferase
LRAAAGARGALLWVADEHVDGEVAAAAPVGAGWSALSNRCDVAALLRARGLPTALTDFDFTALAQAAPEHIVFRVAKEKALVHHVINRALGLLRPGGRLWLAGGKNEGIKTYFDKAAARAGGSCESERFGNQWLGVIARGAELGAPLPDQDYAALRRVPLDGELAVWSKPGVFGWQKLDAGSAFLAAQLAAVWPRAPRRVLDLGCGYGYLSLQAARRWPQAEIVATDNNVAAVAACTRNFSEFAVRGQCLAADCAAGIAGEFDALLCNPPFHQGFDVESELTGRFLQAARQRLARGGRALFVVNQFIALERRAQRMFQNIQVLARDKSFKLVVLER